ncbi:hypothetical protein ABB37_06284 [Leptomonas pyrrhocoris]|uniref:Uncharacterized protein n=1 Tax=Leptomonas pyrrhocoris TaxID=157538 RepID=A0A0N0DUB3_LEPPY|nr:hypothetical protein ABB37_06284 [Leptomonas pyrrhocoris]KPA78684.1 hypothetical protein ABB37_06284 [Leptomonas pyrrhocoris]|eukprot:XP_015657123.1 hypothetical protein ABB37_06284 [Leptomonas pyrrhocoris]
MSQGRRDNQTLPRLGGATASTHTRDAIRTYGAADKRAAAPLTNEWTSIATLRRVYAPSAPMDVTQKLSKRRTGRHHHLVPLDARDSAKRRDDTDAQRFMAAVEESQRTAIKFEEHRHRLHVLNRRFAQERLVESAPHPPTLYAECVEEPREVNRSDASPERPLIDELKAPTPVKPSVPNIRPQRELMSAHVVDGVLQSCFEERRDGGRTSVSLPHLAAEEEQPPPLSAVEEGPPSDSAVPTDATKLRRLRHDLSAMLLDAWCADIGTDTSRKGVAAEEVAVLREMSEEPPHTPLRSQHSDADLVASETVEHSDDDLKRAGEAEVSYLVDDALQASEAMPSSRPLHPTASESPTKQSSPPPVATHAEEEVAAEEVDNALHDAGAGKDTVDDGALCRARREEAAALVSEAIESRDSELPALQSHAEEAPASPEEEKEADALHSMEAELPRLVDYATEPPAEAEERPDERADLREARRKKAASWVACVFSPSPSTGQETPEAPHEAEVSSASNKSAAPSALHASEAQLPCAQHATDGERHGVAQAGENATVHASTDRDVLHSTQLAEAGAQMDDALQHRRREAAAREAPAEELNQLHSLEAEVASLHATASESPTKQSSPPPVATHAEEEVAAEEVDNALHDAGAGKDTVDDGALCRARREEAAALVSEAIESRDSELPALQSHAEEAPASPEEEKEADALHSMEAELPRLVDYATEPPAEAEERPDERADLREARRKKAASWVACVFSPSPSTGQETPEAPHEAEVSSASNKSAAPSALHASEAQLPCAQHATDGERHGVAQAGENATVHASTDRDVLHSTQLAEAGAQMDDALQHRRREAAAREAPAEELNQLHSLEAEVASLHATASELPLAVESASYWETPSNLYAMQRGMAAMWVSSVMSAARRGAPSDVKQEKIQKVDAPAGNKAMSAFEDTSMRSASAPPPQGNV